MSFRTKVPIPSYDFMFNHDGRILSMGSCFSENIGAYLQDRKFPIQINPFGILYNPHAITKGLEIILEDKPFQEQYSLFAHNGLWYSFMHHSRFVSTSQKEAYKSINRELDQARSYIKTSSVLMITLGTAYVYEYHKTHELVANCHKLPNRDFTKKRLSITAIVDSLSRVFLQILAINPDLRIILTVSPVRHLRDGLVDNQVSKSILRVAVDEIVNSMKQVYYFPSYEIVIDELRDYRFFEKDMLHPNEVAIDYIWEQFTDAFFEDSTQALNKQFLKIRQAMNHKPFQPDSKAHKTFLEKQLVTTLEYQKQFPLLDFSKEIAFFQE